MPFEDNEIYHREAPYMIRSVSSETRDPDHGLMLCTEYLGFESYDMRMSDKEVENKMKYHHAEEATETSRKTKENLVVRDGNREFPPLLSSLNDRGQRSFYLRPVRKDGRLELTKVMIDRQETFHASREDGRLRLHLVDAYYDSQQTMDFEDESNKVLENFNNENKGGNMSISAREVNEDETDHQVVDLSMIFNDDTYQVSLNSDDGVAYDVRELENNSCSKIIARRNYEENDYHDDHHHYYHHIHPYHHHHNSNIDMHLWNQTYVKTR